MNDVLISVIVPIYKVEKYLARCVDSILCQTYQNLEVILVDDGSPDGCGAICDAYAQKDSRVRVIHKPNGGLSSARNAGIDAAAGEYLAFIDSDDWIDADMMELLYNTMLHHNAQIAECSFRHILQNRVEEETPCTASCIVGTNLDALEGCLDWKHFKPVACNKLYSRKIIQDIRYPVGRLHEDEFTTYKFFYNADKVVYIDVSKYNYDHTREDSITNKKFNEDHLDACFAFRERAEFFHEHNIVSLEKKMNDMYVWVLWDRLSLAARDNIYGPKVEQLVELAKKDIACFSERPMSPDYRSKLAKLAEKGMRSFTR